VHVRVRCRQNKGRKVSTRQRQAGHRRRGEQPPKPPSTVCAQALRAVGEEEAGHEAGR